MLHAMPYQPHQMLPADLKDFTAPSWWRLHGEKVYAAIFAALVTWHAVNEIMRAGQGQYARRSAVSHTTASAELASSPSISCKRLDRGQWLRAAVFHDGDLMLKDLGVFCYYGHAQDVRFAP